MWPVRPVINSLKAYNYVKSGNIVLCDEDYFYNNINGHTICLVGMAFPLLLPQWNIAAKMTIF